jgi:hypoxanthine-guanine phosphoribosyltransferase
VRLLVMVHKDIKRVLFTEDEIKAAVQKVADQINRDYASTEDLVVIGTGAKGPFSCSRVFSRINKNACRYFEGFFHFHG